MTDGSWLENPSYLYRRDSLERRAKRDTPLDIDTGALDNAYCNVKLGKMLAASGFAVESLFFVADGVSGRPAEPQTLLIDGFEDCRRSSSLIGHFVDLEPGNVKQCFLVRAYKQVLMPFMANCSRVIHAKASIYLLSRKKFLFFADWTRQKPHSEFLYLCPVYAVLGKGFRVLDVKNS